MKRFASSRDVLQHFIDVLVAFNLRVSVCAWSLEMAFLFICDRELKFAVMSCTNCATSMETSKKKNES